MTATSQTILDLIERVLLNMDLWTRPVDAKTRRRRMPMAKELLQRQIDAADRQIDRLWY